MSRVPVPFEVIERIIWFCESSDLRTLRACSLSHSYITPLCQKRLFRNVRVSGIRWPKLLLLLESRVHIRAYIRQLSIWDFGFAGDGQITSRLSAHLLPHVVTIHCVFNVRVKSEFFVHFHGMDTLVIGKNCHGPMRLNPVNTQPDLVHLRRLHVTKPFQSQDDLVNWVMSTGSRTTLNSIRLCFSSEDHPNVTTRVMILLSRAQSLSHVMFDVTAFSSSMELPSRYSEHPVNIPRLCIKARVNERTIPLVLGLLSTQIVPLHYLAIWLVSSSSRPNFGPEVNLQQTYDTWSVSPETAVGFQRVKIVIEECQPERIGLGSFCRLFRVHDLPGVMEVVHVSRDRIATELIDFV